MRVNIGILESEKWNGVNLWRCFYPFSYLQKEYGDEVSVRWVRSNQFVSMVLQDLIMFDVLIVYRPTNMQLLSLVNLAKNYGVRVILDMDDDLLNLPTSHPMWVHFKRSRDAILKGMELADHIWVSTEPLIDVCDAHGRSTVVPNAIHENLLPAKPHPIEKTVIWRGNDAQVSDCIYGKDWYYDNQKSVNKWFFMGYNTPLKHGSNAHFLDVIPSEMYLQSLYKIRANAVWKPLEPNAFNDAKSNIAWIEATIGGGYCVTNYAGQPQWEYAVKDLTWDEKEVQYLWEQSAEAIRDKYSIQRSNALRMESIRALMQTPVKV